MAAPKRTTKAQSEEGIARFLAALDAHTKLLAFFFGLCFVAALLVLAVWFPQPTAFQYTVFRIVLALAAAGVAGVIPGMIRLKAQPGTALLIHAGGALAVFVMVYLLAPAALPQEQPAPNSPPPKEKSVVSQPLKISNVDAIENGVHIVNMSPPESVYLIRLSNIGDTPVHISLIGFPKQYFYTNLMNEELTLKGHTEKEIYIAMLLSFSDQKEFFFKIEDSADGVANIAIRLKEGWNQYLFNQIKPIINVKNKNSEELYRAAKQIVYSSGYKELEPSAQENIAGKLLIAELRRPKIGTLDKSNTDIYDWKILCKLGVDGLKVYLDRHPDGKWADVARTRLRSLSASASDRKEEEQAQALYEWQMDISQASSSRTVEQFLQRFPVGIHVPEAKKRLEELRAIGH